MYGKCLSGFKCEWMTVRENVLWVGGLGKEWTSTVGVVQNLHPQWVKSVGHLGDVQHHDWVDKYNALREKGGFVSPGMLLVQTCSSFTIAARVYGKLGILQCSNHP